jgi:enediyne biosynthesis protein E4
MNSWVAIRYCSNRRQNHSPMSTAQVIAPKPKNSSRGHLSTIMRPMTRREMLPLLAGLTAGARGQQPATGIASRGVKAARRERPSGRPFNARLTDIGHEAGLAAPAICGPVDHVDYIVETMGAGVAFFDYDNDGWLDIFVLSGTRLDGAPPGTTNRLNRNNRDGTFTDVTEKAGLTRTGWAFGVTVGDYNNDGFEDLFVTYFGQNRLYRNNGDGTFTDVTAKAGLLYPSTRFGSGCTFVDYNRDGLLDLFVSNYCDIDLAHAPKPNLQMPNCQYEGVPVNCGPSGLPLPAFFLYRNNGDGTFTDVSKP